MAATESMTQTAEQRRSEYIAGLRRIADVLEAKPDLPLPTNQVEWAVHHYSSEPDEQRAIMATIARALPGKLAKNSPEDGGYGAKYFTLTGRIGGVRVEAWAERANVCKRVVTGQREVTTTVPVQTEEVTVTEDVVEWVCEPLLAEVTQ